MRKHKRLTEEEKAGLIADYRANRMTMGELACKYEIAENTVAAHAKRANLPPKMRPDESPRKLKDNEGGWVKGLDGISRWVWGAGSEEAS